MKLTAGQCPALLTAIGKEIRDLWHGFKTFVTGDYTEIDMGGSSAKTADGEGSDETASNETNREAKIPTVKETFDPDIFWYGGTQGVMKLTAGQCPALLAAIGKEIRDLWHGFKTFSSTKKISLY